MDRTRRREVVLTFTNVDPIPSLPPEKVLDLDGYVIQTLVNFQECYAKILKGEDLYDTQTKTSIPTFTAPLTRVFSDLLLLVGVAPMKAAVEKQLDWPIVEKRVGLVSSCPLNSSFVAA